jgi:predicted acyltransferase
MVLVNDPAMGPPFLYRQLTHSPWDGWTFADTIFPAFIFMVGASMAFSMARYLDGREARSAALPRILRRAVLLVLLGLLVNGFGLLLGQHVSVLGHLRLPGVLQRIAVAYLIGSLAVLYLRTRAQVVAVVVLLFGYWAALEWVPVPHFGAGSLTPHGNLAAWVDRQIFSPAHLYGGGTPGYDPEGLLGSVVSTAGLLVGYWCGRLLRSARSEVEKVLWLAATALAAVAGGLAWSHVLPVNKRMWTPSFVLLMTGLSIAALLVSHLLFDRRARAAAWASLPLRVLGTNAIVVYVGSELAAAALAHYHHDVGHVIGAPIPFWLWARYLVPPFGLTPGALAYAVGLLLAWWLVAWVLYWRRWFLRV